jgi:pimeloyl-ACP methyl ester carboxylesterase
MFPAPIAFTRSSSNNSQPDQQIISTPITPTKSPPPGNYNNTTPSSIITGGGGGGTPYNNSFIPPSPSRGRVLLFPFDDPLREHGALERLGRRSLDVLILPKSMQGANDCAHCALPSITKFTSDGIFSALLNPDKKSSRPVIICIHGISGCGFIFSPLSSCLTNYSTLVIDLPGRGNSRGSTIVTSSSSSSSSQDQVSILDRYVNCIVESMKLHGISELSPVHIIGHSMGGLIALELATKINALSVVLLAPAGVQAPPMSFFPLVQTIIGLPFMKPLVKSLLIGNTTTSSSSSSLPPGDILNLAHDDTCKRLDYWIREWYQFFDNELSQLEFMECLSKLPIASNQSGVKKAAMALQNKSACKVKLFYSSSDPMINLRSQDLQFYQQEFKHQIEIENVQDSFPNELLGHCFFVQQANWVNKRIEEFLVAQDKCG